MEGFVEVRLAESISSGSTFTPTYSTDIGTSLSGYEQANPNWENTIIEADLTYAIRSQLLLDELINHFHTMEGRAYAFRVKDFSDYRSKGAVDPIPNSYLDQTIIESATGGETTAQIYKIYKVTGK